jgi:hypothetical protein
MITGRRTRLSAAGAIALSILAPALASAGAPSPLVGTVADFHGKYGLVVRDANGRVVDVVLHRGTIIKPEGLRLERGMQVTVLGQAADRAFAADQIDTPYKLPPSRDAKRKLARTGNDLPQDRGFSEPAGRLRTDQSPADRAEPRVKEPLVP